MADPLKLVEMLHPMRPPPLPDSIVPGLVMLATGCLVAAASAGLAWHGRRRTSNLRASALSALAETRVLNPADRLAAQAAVLRWLAHALVGNSVARQQGGPWLASLDRCFRTDFFSAGAGTVYGDALYRPATAADIESLDRSLGTLFSRVRSAPRPKANA
jgi:hypothetical protein